MTHTVLHTVCVLRTGLMPEMAGLEEELHSYIARQRYGV